MAIEIMGVKAGCRGFPATSKGNFFRYIELKEGKRIKALDVLSKTADYGFK